MGLGSKESLFLSNKKGSSKREIWKRCKNALLFQVCALVLSCSNALMYTGDYVSMHINIWCALSYYPLRALSQSGEPRVSQTWGCTTGWWLWPGAQLCKVKGGPLCATHEAAGLAMVCTTPCITARAQNRLPKPFLQMQIKVCTQKAATLSYQGLKDAVTACGRKVTKNPPGSLALPFNGAHKMVAPPCCRVGPPVICTKWKCGGMLLLSHAPL